MEDMIFGIGQMPLDDGDEDEESPLWVFVTDKETWDNNHCCNDVVSEEVRNTLSEVGLQETMEAVFEAIDISTTREQIHNLLEHLGFTYDQEFETFMASSMDEE